MLKIERILLSTAGCLHQSWTVMCYLRLQFVTVRCWRALCSNRVKSLFAQQPVGLMTPFTLSGTQKHTAQILLWILSGRKKNQKQTCTWSHLHFNFPSFLQLKRSSLDKNVSSVLRYVNLQGCEKCTQVNAKNSYIFYSSSFFFFCIN